MFPRSHQICESIPSRRSGAMGDAFGLPCEEEEKGHGQFVQRLPSRRVAPGLPLDLPLEGAPPAEVKHISPRRWGGEVQPALQKSDRLEGQDFLLPAEKGMLEDVIATLRAERHPEPLGDADGPAEDTESVPKAMGPHLGRHHPGAGQALQVAEGDEGGSLAGASEGQPQVEPQHLEDDAPQVGKMRSFELAQRRSPGSAKLRAARSGLPFSVPELPQVGELGSRPPDTEERRWIEAAVRRIFLLLSPASYDTLLEAFREWKLPAGSVLVQQATPVSKGPGFCVLLDGVVDVLHCPSGSKGAPEKVCTYDRCGQCFGELELFYETRGPGNGRKPPVQRCWGEGLDLGECATRERGVCVCVCCCP
ncbi:unnamed protein product [Effrenium voratum]|nr:unnamed protein product [Effrenium voratum]